MPRDTPLKKTLFACDELSGFVHACGLVRPDGLDGLEPKSVRKKLKQPSFAAGVHRDEVYAGAELLGARARRAHRERDRGAAADRGRARAAHGGRRRRLASAREPGRKALEVVVARPPAARRPHEAATGDLADVDSHGTEPLHERGRLGVLDVERRRASTAARARRARREAPGGACTSRRRQPTAPPTNRAGARVPRAWPALCRSTTSRSRSGARPDVARSSRPGRATAARNSRARRS